MEIRGKLSTQSQSIWDVIFSFMPFILQCSLAFFLWLLADAFAILMVPDDKPVRIRVRQSDIFQTAFIVVGAWLVVFGTSNLARYLLDYFFYPSPTAGRIFNRYHKPPPLLSSLYLASRYF